MRRRNAPDNTDYPAAPAPKTSEAPQLGGTKKRRITGKRFAFPAQRWCPSPPHAKRGSLFQWSLGRLSTLRKLSGFSTPSYHNVLQF
jgi:hypothetical protein